MKRFLALVLAVIGLGAPGADAQPDPRRPWSEVLAPQIESLGARTDDPRKLSVVFALVTGTDGADKAVVELIASGKILESRTLGKSRADRKTVDFLPASSGSYRVRITAQRNATTEVKTVETDEVVYVLPLEAPAPGVRNLGGGSLEVKWAPVTEAEAYRIRWTAPGLSGASEPTRDTRGIVESLVAGRTYTVTVEAFRAAEVHPSAPVIKLIRSEPEREWHFTWFGQSTKAELNTAEVLDADNLKVRLRSATFLPDGSIDQKGGKFTTFHDGISFFYTAIDPKTENFELKATFTVDALNPTPDGQEGFGLLALDSLGAPGISMVNHYTNSAGLIATKFEAVVDGVKKTGKDTLGARMVSGITPEVLAQGDTGIARHGVNVSTAYSYEASDQVAAGRSYTLTLRKTNTGYHAVYRDPAGQPVEHILYGADKLAALDPDHDYIGFAAARGANVTVSGVSLTFSDPRIDPPGRDEPRQEVPLMARIDSPSASGDPLYPMVFTANADGRLTVRDPEGRKVADQVVLRAGDRWKTTLPLTVGRNDFAVNFEVAPGYGPTPRSLVAPGSAEILHSVYHRTYPGTVLKVTPGGSSLGNGTPERPLNLATALAFVGPGQTIELADGTYRPRGSVVIERGNDGTKARPKTLRAAPGAHPVFDFSGAAGGMTVWGEWWILEGFAVTLTPGNVKGLQIGGSHNVVRNVEASLCGDTGIQISGSGSEPAFLWPVDNLVENCLSWGNCDPAQNNADGFAAKLTCGEGNVFRRCMAYNNIDDGWDLFSKIETGPIGAVVIESCIAFRNGSLPDGSGNGDGNGFKLGGDGIAVAHVLRHSLAFENGASGITSNSDPAVILERNTAFGNRGPNVNLYGKGNGARLFQVRGTLSLRGGAADVYREMPELASADNFFWTGAQAANSLGQTVGTEVFVRIDTGLTPSRKPDGALDLQGLFVLTDRAPNGSGALIGGQAPSSVR